MPSPSIKNRIAALEALFNLRVQDAVALARSLTALAPPPAWPPLPDPRGIDKAGFQKLLALDASRPDHPLNWHASAIQKALNEPRALRIYMSIRRNLWQWPEFLTLNEKARAILEIVIELARDEAFPWYVPAQARHVMKLARTNHATMAAALRELQCFAITRPARRIRLLDFNDASPFSRAVQLPRWPCRENGWRVNPDEPLEEIPQWIIRYRHGTPRRPSRAAWWINYDLLCGTQRVLPCFEVKLDTLAKTYENRNRRLGTRAGIESDEAFRAMERQFALDGPLPPPGLRTALWHDA